MASGTITKSKELKSLTVTNLSIDSGGNVMIPSTINWNNAIPVCFEPTSAPSGSLRSWRWSRYSIAIYIVWSTPADKTLSGILYYYDKI